MIKPDQTAFPGTTYEGNTPWEYMMIPNPGMTKREYMATQILSGIVSYNGGYYSETVDSMRPAVKRSVILADLLVEELNRKRDE